MGLPLAGARPAPPAQQTPQFRGGTDIVPVDFRAYGPNGMPVTDLTAKDIRLVVDGKAREIKTFQFVRLSFTSVEAPKAAPMLSPPFASNEGERPGRSVVIVIDQNRLCG